VTDPTPLQSDSAPVPADEFNIAEAALMSSTVTAATTLGILIGLGRQHSTLWRPLNAAAHVLLGARADDLWGFQLDVTPVGCAVVLVVSAVAGVVVAGFTSSRRFLHSAVVAIGVALAGYLVHSNLVARSAGGLASLLTTGELRALYASAAIALLAGMRYAFSVDGTAPSA
jgi:hypothetical protein